MNFIWEALIILFVGFCLQRIAGKKTVSEMTGLEIITLLSIASLTGHAVSEQGLWKTIITLCIFVAFLIIIQYLAVKFGVVEKLFMGKATTVIKDGKVITENLKKLRMTVDQLETRLREKGISSFTDVKTGRIEITGHFGYELISDAKPVTVGELEKILARYLDLSKQQMDANQQLKKAEAAVLLAKELITQAIEQLAANPAMCEELLKQALNEIAQAQTAVSQAQLSFHSTAE